MTNGELHLSNLLITNFRGIRNLSIGQLRRVNLITGLNGVGKTTLLEAIRVYAARGSFEILNDILYSRDEVVESIDEDKDFILSPDYSLLFYEGLIHEKHHVSIGPISDKDSLKIETVDFEDLPQSKQELFPKLTSGDHQALKVTFHDAEVSVLPWLSEISDLSVSEFISPAPRVLRRLSFGKENMADPIRCESLGPGLITNDTLAEFWDKIVLTPQENLSLKVINLTGQNIERIAVVGQNFSRFLRSNGRRFSVKIKGKEEPVPLKTLGDAIIRLYAVGLAMAVSKNGFLLIDEIENGIHFTIQQDLCRIILEAAKKLNVQVFATTHSIECIKAFSRAASDGEESDVALIRLEYLNGDLRAVEYSEEELRIATNQHIEVR